MTQKPIHSTIGLMIEQILNGEPNADRKACVDCRDLQAAMGWWCTNQAAIDRRGTREPGISQCPNWRAARTVDQLSHKERHSLSILIVEPIEG